MARHKFETLADFKGRSLDYFTTHAELVRLQGERKARKAGGAEAMGDGAWSGEEFVKQSDALSRG